MLHCVIYEMFIETVLNYPTLQHNRFRLGGSHSMTHSQSYIIGRCCNVLTKEIVLQPKDPLQWNFAL